MLRPYRLLGCKLDFSNILLARLYPFEIEVILDAAWVPLSSSSFQTSPHTTDIEKSQEHILKYQNYQWQWVLEFG
jgi:hypothetical protein